MNPCSGTRKTRERRRLSRLGRHATSSVSRIFGRLGALDSLRGNRHGDAALRSRATGGGHHDFGCAESHERCGTQIRGGCPIQNQAADGGRVVTVHGSPACCLMYTRGEGFSNEKRLTDTHHAQQKSQEGCENQRRLYERLASPLHFDIVLVSGNVTVGRPSSLILENTEESS